MDFLCVQFHSTIKLDKKLHIFQNGIGYFYYDQNVKKKLLSGSQAGIFFIQNT